MMHIQTRLNFDMEMEMTKMWVENMWFINNILPAMMMMTEQLSTIAMQQVEMIGMFLDAKHQLETQRLFQELTAEAHKDYMPSEGVCTIGTAVRSLAASERSSEYNTHVVAERTMQRQLLSGDVVSKEGDISDAKSRLQQFVDVYCDPADNFNGLNLLCQDQARATPVRRNRDIDYTRTMESPLTLSMNFMPGAEADTGLGPQSFDEEDVFALAANLFAHETPPAFKDTWMSNSEGAIREEGAALYMDMRAVAAKRSVAQNSYAAIAGMKSSGAPEVQPFLYAIVQEFGLPHEEIALILGASPSYFAQMEVLTKKLYQNPNFYSDLYDKPANVDRKAAALQAIALMQDRDTYRSLLRSEAMLAVLLEMKLIKEQQRVNSEISSLTRAAPAAIQ